MAPIKVPKQDILQDTDDSLIYKIDEMAILTSDNGDSYSVDGIVDSRIITEESSSVTGITDYQVDLSSATKMEGDEREC